MNVISTVKLCVRNKTKDNIELLNLVYSLKIDPCALLFGTSLKKMLDLIISNTLHKILTSKQSFSNRFKLIRQLVKNSVTFLFLVY